MANFVIPNDVLDREMGGGQALFPKGEWQGVIEKVRSREIYEGDGGDFFLKTKDGVFFADHLEVITIQIGSNVALADGQDDPGERKFFDENIFLSIGDYSWEDDLSDAGDDYWRLRQSQAKLTRIARALDLVDEIDGGVTPVAEFSTMLRETDDNPAGGLNGSGIGYKVIHRSFKRKDGTKGESAEVVQYFQV